MNLVKKIYKLCDIIDTYKIIENEF